MTKAFSFFAGVLLVSSALFSCTNDPKTAENATPSNEPARMAPLPSSEGAATFVVEEGLVHWLGRKSIRGQHNGTFKVKGGEFKVKENQILSGKVIIDMTSLANLDLTDPKEKGQLEGHLKSADFLDVNRYPEGEFTVEEVLPSTMKDFDSVVSGMLKLKDKSVKVNIPVKLKVGETDLSAESATFIINRTQWGITYASGIIGAAKDKMIDDNVSLGLHIKAKKQ